VQVVHRHPLERESDHEEGKESGKKAEESTNDKLPIRLCLRAEQMENHETADDDKEINSEGSFGHEA
jgi:hypothetical protein